MGRYHFPYSVIGLFLVLLCCAVLISADDYTVAEGNKSLIVAIGCFWCAEQAFEQYAPGVVEAVSGYAGGTNDNPTYRNHPGHYEVILIEYDPAKTSYELLVNYAYRNMDPFDGNGQFCDKGSSYYPAIYYETEDELMAAETVLAEILEMNPDWSEDDIKAPILERPTFWTAETYHQDYYIKKPSNYGYYKNACGRTQRLKEVWGKEEYECFHDEEYSCLTNTNITIIDPETGEEAEVEFATVVNADGELVKAETNIKNAQEETVGLIPRWQIILLSILGAIVACGLILFVALRCCSSKENME